MHYQNNHINFHVPKRLVKKLSDNTEVSKLADCISKLFWQPKPKQRDNKLILLSLVPSARTIV